MISDVLSEAVFDIDYYLENAAFRDTYTGKMRQRIVDVRNEMNEIRKALDKFPTKKQVIASRKKALAKKSKTRKT